MGMGHPGSFENGAQHERVEGIQQVCLETRAAFTERFDRLEVKIDAVGKSVGILKGKAAAWGGVAGAIIVVAAQFLIHVLGD